MRLKGKVAVITGAGRGIGRAIALGFAKEGANLAVASRTFEEIDETATIAHGLGVQAYPVKTDLANPSDIEALMAQVVKRYGRLDILVNNASIMEKGNLEDISPERWNRTFAVNLTGSFLCCKSAVPHMKKLGWGRIINISSIAAFTSGGQGQTAGADYAASKAGQIALTRKLAAELGPYGITVNAIAPGAIDTPMHGDRFKDPEVLKAVAKMHAVQRIGKPEDIANVAVFLALPETDFITGTTILVHGGRVII